MALHLVTGDNFFRKLNLTVEVTGTGCFICTNRKPNKDGYIMIRYDGITTGLHRVIWQMTRGRKIPQKSMVVRHTCDNPACINPLHLKIGTMADNNRDRDNRDRTAKGGKIKQALLTDDQVRYIKRSNDTPTKELAEKFNVHKDTIRDIRNGRNWKHIAA
jgi:hypothetical protein